MKENIKYKKIKLVRTPYLLSNGQEPSGLEPSGFKPFISFT